MLSNKQTIFAILAAAAQLGEARQLSQERQLSASWTVASDYWCTYWLDYLRNWGLLTLPTISGINTQTDEPNTCWSSSGEVWYEFNNQNYIHIFWSATSDPEYNCTYQGSGFNYECN